LGGVLQAQNETLAVVRFTGLIDHRLAPINDEGLGRHRYVASGLQPYSFNELVGTEETQLAGIGCQTLGHHVQGSNP